MKLFNIMFKKNIQIYFSYFAIAYFILIFFSQNSARAENPVLILKNFSVIPQIISSSNDTLKALFDFETNSVDPISVRVQFYVSTDTIQEKFGPNRRFYDWDRYYPQHQ